MAGPTCVSCGAKTKKNQPQCDGCRKKVVDTQQGEQKEICNEILMYANYHRGSSTKECVINALATTSDVDSLKEAKDILYKEYGDLGLFEEYKNRVSSNNRTDKMALSEDIVVALFILADNMIPVKFTASDWEKIPKVHPSRLSDIAMADQVAELSSIVYALQSTLSSVKADVLVNSSKIKGMESEHNTHGKLIQQCFNKLDGSKDKAEWPALQNVITIKDDNKHNDNRLAPASVPQAGHAPAGRKRAASASAASDREEFQLPKEQIRRDLRRNRYDQKKSQNLPADNTQNSARSFRKTVVGQAQESTLRAAPSPSRDVFISRVHKGDGVTEVENFIKSIGVTPRSISLACHEESKFNSFKLSVSMDDVIKVMDPSIWPRGVRLRKWFDSKVASSERLSTPSST